MDLTSYNEKVIKKTQENLRKYGKQLLRKTKLDYDEFKLKVKDYKDTISVKPKDIDVLKGILQKISKVRNESQELQLQMFTLRERVRIFFL